MARKPRIHFPGTLYHVISRGNQRQNIFIDDKDLSVFLSQELREGQKIRLRGMGAEGEEGGEPGDLYLKVKFRKPLLQKVREILKNG